MDNQDKHEKGKKNKHHGGGLLALAIAAAIGTAAGIIFAPKSGEETRDDLSAQAALLAKKFTKTRADIQKSLKEIFGDVSEELEKNYIQVRANVLEGVENLKERSELTQRKYNEIVETAVAKYAEGRDWTVKSINELIKNIQQDWQDINTIPEQKSPKDKLTNKRKK